MNELKGLAWPLLLSTLLITGVALVGRWQTGGISAQYGAERRRVYWERESGLVPLDEGLSQLARRDK